ncbi:hypothetical protein ACQE2J_18465 [Brevibacterium sp. LE-L]|uniref:hypothetical protein n=1 Tax=Brevibacterium sp. LE-L TaxID=3418557 RepID=UPI003CF69B1B
MTKQLLYPFPRIPTQDLEWGEWAIRINGVQVSETSIADEWDANSELVLGVSVRVRTDSFSRLDVGNPVLTLTATCPSTAFVTYAEAEFRAETSTAGAGAEVRIAGAEVSQILVVRPEIIGDDQSEAWLRRRILAEGPSLRLPLDTELDGFPTSSYSFTQRGMPDAPWRIVVSADGLEAPFAHSIRLELNEDYAPVRKLIAGQPEPHLARELDATIVRVLVGTAARLSSGSSGEQSPDSVAAEFPDSIAAAAQRAAQQYLHLSLTAAVKSYRLTPEKHEYEVANGTRLFKD